MPSSESWPEVALLIAYAVLNEIRAWRIAKETTVVRQAVGRNTQRVKRVSDVVESVTGTPVLRRKTDHDDLSADPHEDPGSPPAH